MCGYTLGLGCMYVGRLAQLRNLHGLGCVCLGFWLDRRVKAFLV